MPRSPVAVLVAVHTILLAGCQSNQESPTVFTDPFAAARSTYLAALDTAAGGPFVPCDDLAEKLDKSYFASRRWAGVVFRDGAGPHGAHSVRRSYHVATPDTLDLIRYEYDWDEWSITVLESAVFLYSEVRAREPSAQPDLEAVADLFTRIHAAPQATRFAFLGGGREVFSSAPHRDIAGMTTWTDRVDGVLRSSGAVGFLIYKVHVDFTDLFKDPAKWFPDGVRGP